MQDSGPPPPPPPPPPLGGSNAAPSDDKQYEFMTVNAVRGREASTIAKWQESGWELLGQTKGRLRTELTLRRVVPKSLGLFATLRGLKPKTQRLLLALLGFVVLAVGIGIMVAIQSGGGVPEPAAQSTEAVDAPSEEPADPPTPEPKASETSEPSEPEESTPAAETYTYDGPKYEIVTVDESMGPADLNEYWVHTSRFDYSTDAYRDQVKAIISDIVRKENTAELIVQVVTDREVIEAEAASTYAGFVKEHGMDYVLGVVVPKEKSAWAAAYTGGFDPDARSTK